MKLTLPAAQRPLFETLVGKTVEVSKLEGNGTGTGVVLTADGLIVTAYHVITRSRVVRVRRLYLEDTRWRIQPFGKLTADVLFRDKKRDIAVVRLRKPPADLPFADLADSTRFKVGDPLYRVGRDDVPLASGHVLAMPKARSPHMEVSMPAKPGSSGGPLFTEWGTVAGICLQYQSNEGLPQLAYVMPSDDLLRHILRRKHLRTEISEEDAKRLGI